MERKVRVGSLMRGAARALGNKIVQLTEPPEEVSDDELLKRVRLAESIRKLVKTEEFAAFHVNSVEKIRTAKDELIRMKAIDFEGPEGMETKGFIRGWQKAFERLREITISGDHAEQKLVERKRDVTVKI